MITPSTIRELAEKWLNGTITESEKQLFENWYNTHPGQTVEWTGENDREELKQAVLSNVLELIGEEEQAKVVQLSPQRRKWPRIAAAAAVILALGTVSYFIVFNKTPQSQQQANIKLQPVTDVKAPTAIKAMINLADGRTVALDSVSSGMLAMQGDVKVLKNANGEIVYSGLTNETVYNTLVNPKGSRSLSLKLSDGTLVWLNAESTLRYPINFAGSTRKVEVSGEAYFEVAHNAAMPFIVKDVTKDLEVAVLGTHFNVNTYTNEPFAKVTLLEGSVRVNRSTIIKPGQQAQISSGIKVANGVDIEQVMAWKNGIFKFNGEDLQTIMKQVERWYNVEVVYEGKMKPLNFGGVISRKENVSAVLDLLTLTTHEVKFRFEPSGSGAAGKIIVML